jgi:FlaA1/EpsC-like NDP-sugar epimerase
VIRRHITALRLSFMFVDGATAALLFLWLSVVRFGPDFRAQWVASVGLDAFVAAVAYGAGWVATLYMLGLYRLRARWSARTELLDIMRAALFLAVAVFTALFLFKLPNVSRLFLVLLFGSQVVLGLGSRLAVRRFFEALRARGYNTRYMVIVGAGPAAREFADRIQRRRELGLVVVGHLANGEREPDLGRPILVRILAIARILHTGVSY